MALKIGINGFGRIGRLVLRQIYQQGLDSQVKIVAINDLTNPSTLAHLLKYDSVHRTFASSVEAREGQILVNGNSIKVTAERDPAKLGWKDLGVDVVLECTGLFTDKEKASAHLKAGAKRVIISAPSKDADVTIAFGVNQQAYDPTSHTVISCASCTTNCLAPVARVLVDNFGVQRGSMTTVHSYTNDQNILDLPHKDLRRARAGALSIIPTSTGAAKAIGLVIPELKGRADGFALRVPTPDVSLIDFVVELERDATAEEINRALKNASERSLKGILGFSEDPLVSSDYIGCTYSAVVDGLSTLVLQNRLAKVVAWYDNEVGFSCRMIDVTKLVGQQA